MIKNITDNDGKKVFSFDLIKLPIHDQYNNANPFPHFIIDKFFMPRVLNQILKDWPSFEHIDHEYHDDGVFCKHKFGTNYHSDLSPYIKNIFYNLSSPVFLNFLSNLTGIPRLIPDPYYFGGGLHESRNDGFLSIHADFNKHPIYKFIRRLNLIVFLNKKWKSEYGGQLELWSQDGKKKVTSVEPLFNRAVIFNTDSNNFHGHPSPLNIKKNSARRSMAFYYYTNQADDSIKEHTTIWK